MWRQRKLVVTPTTTTSKPTITMDDPITQRTTTTSSSSPIIETEPFIQQPQQQSKWSSSFRRRIQQSLNTIPQDVWKFAVLFASAMIVHELALEAASTHYSQVPGLAASITLYQFGFCLLLPCLIKGKSALNKFPRTLHEIKPYVYLTCLIATSQTCGTQSAIKYVTYPTKVVFKSTKRKFND